jgi:hypothetical protein
VFLSHKINALIPKDLQRYWQFNIYMANGTPKAAWENFIKAKNLEGANVIHYNLPSGQQSMVERRLGVKSFPTYFLFNRKGEMVNDKAPRPSMLDTLVREVDKLLE